MTWLIAIYGLMGVIIAVSAAINAGIGPGLYAFLTIVLVLAAAGGLKANLFWSESKGQTIGGIGFAAVLIAIAWWLSTGFSVRIFGIDLSGTEWGAIGFVICFLFTDRRLAGMVKAG